MKRSIALVLIAALLLAAGLVVAQQRMRPPATAPMRGPGMGMRGPGMGMRGPGMGMMKGDCWALSPGMAEMLKKQLNLTADQVTSLEAIRKDFMDSTQSVKDQIKAKRQQMATLWMADPPDAAAIKDLAAQMDTMRAQMRDSAIDHAVQAIAVLTPAQRAQVKTWMQKDSHMMMGMGCGMCCGAGMCECGGMAPQPTPPAGQGPAKAKATY